MQGTSEYLVPPEITEFGAKMSSAAVSKSRLTYSDNFDDDGDDDVFDADEDNEDYDFSDYEDDGGGNDMSSHPLLLDEADGIIKGTKYIP